MITSEIGINLIKRFEGCELEAYLCPAGKWTIGYGHTGPEVKEGMVITEDRADELLRSDLHVAEQAVEQSVSVPITQPEFDALVSFAFNVGVGALRGSTLLRKLNASDYDGASAEFARWVRGGGKVLPGLVARREAEHERFEATV